MPALKYRGLTPWYEKVVSLSGLGARFKRSIVESAQLNGDEYVADIGCGEGTFLQELSRCHPNIRAYGIDTDLEILRLARKKLTHTTHITVEQGVAQSIPQKDAVFDVVFCTLTMHHLTDEDKTKALKEMYRIIKPGGRIIITDFGPRRFFWMPRLILFEKKALLQSCIEGRLPSFTKDSGFRNGCYLPFKGNSVWLLLGNK